MPQDDFDLENRPLTMEGDYATGEPLYVKNARVVEGMNFLTETKLEFLCKNRQEELQAVVGRRITLNVNDEESGEELRSFTGRCISVDYIGLSQGMGHFLAQIRPFLWFLTRSSDCRVFQEQSVPEIVRAVLEEYGFTSDYVDRTQKSYEKRSFCVQYRESDFAFISRLMEEEGIYYFFEEDNKREKLVLADSISAHTAVPGGPEFKFHYREMGGYRRDEEHIFDWNAAEAQSIGSVQLSDYDFQAPRADLSASSKMETGTHAHKSYQFYDYPGHLRDNEGNDSNPAYGRVAEERAKVQMQALHGAYRHWRGISNIRRMGNGQTFTLTEHPRDQENGDYLIVRATHDLQIDSDYDDAEARSASLDERLEVDDDNKDAARCRFEAVAKDTGFAGRKQTPWPQIAGMHTALVTGPSGEEIHTDKFGRIKIQFPWDRLGEKNENSSCWVRVVMPWAGKQWGMFSIPRIGQEVAIVFEEGNPDRPICIGMIYNQDVMPPYGMPDNKTQTGIVTRSSKQGSADTFHELVFEDLMGEEFVRFQSEKDYFAKIKNNAEITIGMEKMDPGDLTRTIYHDKTETLKTGDKTLTVEEGSEFRTIATDQSEDIGNDRTQSVGNNNTQDIGNDSALNIGNNLAVDVGSHITEDAGQTITVTAGQEIKLQVGGSSITITNSGITIDAPKIDVTGKAMVNVKSPKSTVKGDVLLTLKGAMTFIN